MVSRHTHIPRAWTLKQRCDTFQIFLMLVDMECQVAACDMKGAEGTHKVHRMWSHREFKRLRLDLNSAERYTVVQATLLPRTSSPTDRARVRCDPRCVVHTILAKRSPKHFIRFKVRWREHWTHQGSGYRSQEHLPLTCSRYRRGPVPGPELPQNAAHLAVDGEVQVFYSPGNSRAGQ